MWWVRGDLGTHINGAPVIVPCRVTDFMCISSKIELRIYEKKFFWPSHTGLFPMCSTGRRAHRVARGTKWFFECTFEKCYISFCISNSINLNRGHHEGGRLGSVKNFKTPFFKRYWKFLPWGYSYRCRTSPIFFFLKYLNKYGH